MPTIYWYFYNGRLIDGTGRDMPDAPYAVGVEGRHIRTVAPQADFPAPEGAQTIDMQGKTIMPGLIDCHDHLANFQGGMVVRAAVPPSLAVFMAGDNCRQTLMSGFTSVRDAGGLDLGVKMAVERGLVPGPRLKITVNLLSQLGGHNDHTEPAGIDSTFPILPGVPNGICDGADSCRRKVREMVRAGADWIKICTTGGVGTPTGGPLIRQFSLDEVRAIVDTAHAAGKPVMSHAYGGDGVKICLDAGVDCIEHGAAIDDALIEQMVRQDAWLVPTFTVLRRIVLLSQQHPGMLPDYIVKKTHTLLEVQKVSFAKAMAAGLKMAMGTDLGGFGRGLNAGELAYMVEAGMTPMQAIVAATSMAARCIGFGDEVGVVREGLLADLLVVDGNPLDDIMILQNQSALSLIMKDGQIYKNSLI